MVARDHTSMHCIERMKIAVCYLLILRSQRDIAQRVHSGAQRNPIRANLTFLELIMAKPLAKDSWAPW